MSQTTHHIVAIEAVHCPIPEFNIPQPHTRSIYKWTDPNDLPSRVKDATIIITTTIRLTAETLSPTITPNLRLIVIMATGTDCVDIAAATARNIPVCNCPGSNIDSVSEHAIGLYFATRRKFIELHNATVSVPADPALDTEWKTNGSLLSRLRAPDGKAPFLCADETVCIVGYGALGKRIETLARALGMGVIVAERKGVAPRNGRYLFEDALRMATVVVLCLPRSAETMNMVSEAELGVMSSHAVLINVARGGLLMSGRCWMRSRGGLLLVRRRMFMLLSRLGGGDSPLLSEEAKGLNLVLTPHLAWYSEKTLQNLQKTAKETVEKWCVGETINQVNHVR
ncbi:D-isomer specific 2-hydroxyacid dehydrogenase NAD-binding [Penicillium sp. DV-2018c]|nr:D-isomer specific 2-hydroxyacid dehydrogenase NAD-binding [Penicillium sp. DV-2018c]